LAGGASFAAMSGSARAPEVNRRQRGSRDPWGDSAPRQAPSARSSVERGGTRSTRRFSSLTGIGAVLFIFVFTLVVATIESLIGVGLRTLTLIALAGSTLLAGLWVRRSDIATIVVAPPLVFVSVAVLEIVLAPTLMLTTTVLASVLVRGFPTMSIATAIALLVCGYRVIRHR